MPSENGPNRRRPLDQSLRSSWAHKINALGNIGEIHPGPKDSRNRSTIIGDNDPPVVIYLKEIDKIPLLSQEEEIALTQSLEAGKAAKERLGTDNNHAHPSYEEEAGKKQLRVLVEQGDAAREKLTTANLRLVVSVAKKYQDRGLPLLDLIQEGNIGLTRAVDKFDWKRGFRFSTYAHWWIRQAITRAIADQSRTIRLPVHIIEQIAKINKTSSRLEKQLNREPSDRELLAEMDISPDQLAKAREAAMHTVSLDVPAREDGETTLGDFLEDPNNIPVDEGVFKKLRKEAIGEILDMLTHNRVLTSREKRVLELRFGLEDGLSRTLEEVGDELGVTRERARQIEVEALRKLRHSKARQELKELDEAS